VEAADVSAAEALVLDQHPGAAGNMPWMVRWSARRTGYGCWRLGCGRASPPSRGSGLPTPKALEIFISSNAFSCCR